MSVAVHLHQLRVRLQRFCNRRLLLPNRSPNRGHLVLQAFAAPPRGFPFVQAQACGPGHKVTDSVQRVIIRLIEELPVFDVAGEADPCFDGVLLLDFLVDLPLTERLA